jgi:Skp family chaperone for outer membrane proteins
MPIPPPAPGPGDQQPAAPLAQFQLPPEPGLPPLAKGSAPPAAVIGVLGVPDVMRACAAAQEVERVIGQRRQKLNEDAQKEQTAWRDLQQQLASQRSGLSAEQIRNKERELQERITSAQRQFRERNRVIQEAAQFALAQIERTLVAVIRQVAESRGMNLVLHRNQIALNINEFDLTDQVTAQLNKVLPSVVITAEGQEPPTIPLAQGPAPQNPAIQSPAMQPSAAPAGNASGGNASAGNATGGAAPAPAKNGDAAPQPATPPKP